MKFKLKIKIDNPFCAKLVANDERLIITLRSPKSMERLAKVVPDFTEWAAKLACGNLFNMNQLSQEEIIRLANDNNDGSLLQAMLPWFGFRHSDFAVTSLDEMVEVGCITTDTDTDPDCVRPTGWIGIGPEQIEQYGADPIVDGYRKLYAPSVSNPANYFNHLVSGGSLVFYGVQNDRT